MKFRLARTHRYWWPVIVHMPKGDAPDAAGEVDEVELKVLFQSVERSIWLERQAELAKLPLEAQGDAETEQFLGIVSDWAEVVDEAGKPVPFSEAAFRQAMGITWFRHALFRAFVQSLSGEAARLGN